MNGGGEHGAGESNVLVPDRAADRHCGEEEDEIFDQVLSLGGRNEGKRDEPQVRLEEEGEVRPRNPEEEQDVRNAYERAIPHRQSDGDLPPAKDEDHRFRRSSVDGFRKEGDGRLVAQRFQEAEPDEERSERQAVEAVAIPIEPRDHAVVQLAKRRAVGGAGVAHGAGTS